jgi:hypothetical protein
VLQHGDDTVKRSGPVLDDKYGLRITRIWKTGVVITRKYSVITIQLYLHIRVTQ